MTTAQGAFAQVRCIVGASGEGTLNRGGSAGRARGWAIRPRGSSARVRSGLLVAAAVSASAIAATAAHAQLATSRLDYQVRIPGSTNWSSSVTAQPGDRVEFRALVSYTGSVPVFGFKDAGIQPVVSHWVPGNDVLLPFRTTGGGVAGGVDLDSGEYGRIRPFAGPGISTTNALRGHTNNVIDGVRYLRIAQNRATNWVGVGPTSGSAQANNFSGSGGVQLGQFAPQSVFRTPETLPFDGRTQDVEVIRFGITIGTEIGRTMEVTTPAAGILRTPTTANLRAFNWFDRPDARDNDRVFGAVTVVPATIRVVPSPGVGALAAMGLIVVAARRRR
jgi:hypothetical protein